MAGVRTSEKSTKLESRIEWRYRRWKVHGCETFDFVIIISLKRIYYSLSTDWMERDVRFGIVACARYTLHSIIIVVVVFIIITNIIIIILRINHFISGCYKSIQSIQSVGDCWCSRAFRKLHLLLESFWFGGMRNCESIKQHRKQSIYFGCAWFG